MKWSDVDAVRILAECREISRQDAVAIQEDNECNTMHDVQHFWGPSVGPTAAEDVDPDDGGSVLDDDDVLAALLCSA